MIAITLLAICIAHISAFRPQVSSRSVLRFTPGRTGQTQIHEDFGFFGFESEWDDSWDVMSEANLEKALNQKGLRYRMNRTDKEAESDDIMGEMFTSSMLFLSLSSSFVLLDLPSFKIGPVEINAPKVGSIWEALGFTATGQNDEAVKAKKEWKKALKDGSYNYARFSKVKVLHFVSANV